MDMSIRWPCLNKRSWSAPICFFAKVLPLGFPQPTSSVSPASSLANLWKHEQHSIVCQLAVSPGAHHHAVNRILPMLMYLMCSQPSRPHERHHIQCVQCKPLLGTVLLFVWGTTVVGLRHHCCFACVCACVLQYLAVEKNAFQVVLFPVLRSPLTGKKRIHLRLCEQVQVRGIT